MEKESRDKDRVTAQLYNYIDKLQGEIDRLTVTLRIPRLQAKYLEEKGALAEFVEAKLLGKNDLAKWTLLQAADKEIDEIVRRNAMKSSSSARHYVQVPSKREIIEGKQVLMSRIGKDGKNPSYLTGESYYSPRSGETQLRQIVNPI